MVGDGSGVNTMILAAITPYDTGRILGSLTGAAIAVACLVAAINGLRRPKGNRCCYIGLLLAASAASLSLAFVALQAISAGNPLALMLIGLFVLFTMGTAVTGLIFSGIGLVQIYRSPGKWTSGMAAGWVGLALGLLLGGSVTVGFVAGAMRRNRDGLANWSPPEAIADTGGQWISEFYNYQFRKPPGRWQPLPANPGQDPGRFTLTRAGSSEIFTMIPERLSPSSMVDGDTAWILGSAKLHLQNADFNARISGDKTVKIGSLDGAYFEANWSPAGKDLFSVHWVTASNGWVYQLIISGDTRNSEAVRKDAAAIFAGFSQPDSHRAAPGWEAVAGREFRSKYFPYTISLEGLAWRPVPNLTNTFPAADFRAKAPGGLTLTVVPAILPSVVPPSETVAKALLARTTLSATGDMHDHRAWAKGPLAGEDVTWEGPNSTPPWRARTRFAMGEKAAVLIIADGPLTNVTAAKLDSLLDRVALVGAATNFSVSELPAISAHSQSLVQNDFGIYFYQQNNLGKAAKLFQLAADLWPENPVMLGNECEALATLGQYTNGLARLQSRPQLLATNVALQASLAFFEWQTGSTNQAAETYAKAFDHGLNRLASLGSYCSLLLELGDTNQAVSRIQSFANTNGSPDARMLEARILRRAGQPAAAAKTLEAERDRAGLTQQLGMDLAASYLAATNPVAALKTCADLLAKGYENGGVWYLKGLAEQQQKNYTAAKTNLETAVRLAPGDETIRAALARASALLGQGDNFAIKNPIDPVTLPEDLASATPAPLPRGEVEAHGAQYLDRSTAIEFRRGGRHAMTERFRVQIYNETGLERFRTLSFSFDPLSQSIFVNELTVRGASGKVIATGKTEDYYVTDDSAHAAQGLASSGKQLNIPVPGLQAGMTLEVAVTWKYAPDPDFSWHDEVLERQTPAARLLTVVKGDVDSLVWEASPELKTQRGPGYIAFSREHAPAWISEYFEPAFAANRPRLAITDAGRTWASEATNYLSRIADKLGPDTDTKAAYLIQGVPDASRLEQIRTLAGYVQTQCSYRAIEFGRRAQVPARAGETLRHHYGDCKDQAVLLRELLALGGIEAHLALASTAGAVRTNLPSLDQFNHMLVYVPGPDAPLYIDTTARAADPFLTPLWALGGSQIFVLDPKAPRFVPVPALSPDDTLIKVNRQIAITNETGLILNEQVEADGLAATWLRSMLAGRNGDSFKDKAQRFADPIIPGLQVDSLNCDGFENSLLPIKIQMKAHASGYLQLAGNRLVGSIPALWEKLWISPGPVRGRHAPLEIRQPWHIQASNHIDWPEGYNGPAASSLSGHQAGDFVVADAKADGSFGRQIFITECTGLPGLFPAERGTERQQAVIDGMRLISPSFVLEKKAPGQ